MNVSIAESAYNCYQDLQEASKTVIKERERQFQTKPLAQRVGYYACEILRWGGMAVAAVSLGVGTFFSSSFYLSGILGALAFGIGVYARSYFETFSFLEQEIIKSIDQLNFKKEAVPTVQALKAARELYIDVVAKADQSNEKVKIFNDYFGKDRRDQVRQLYATSLLLEAIQHIAKKQFSLATACAKNAEKVNIDPPMLQFKMNTLAEKLQKKEVQEKVYTIFSAQKIFKLADLDTVYNIA